MFVSHLYVFFGENVSLSFLSSFFVCLFEFFVVLILSLMKCLYILEMNHLSPVSFANIFFYSEGFCFILFMISFFMQKLLSLIKSLFVLILVCMFITLGDRSKKILLGFVRGCSMFSSKSLHLGLSSILSLLCV